MIKAILLDIDNTLISFEEYVKFIMKKGFAEFNLCEYKDEMFDVFKSINDGLWLRIEKHELTFEELEKIRWDMVFEKLGITFDGIYFEKYFKDNLFDNAILEPYALETVKYLAGKYDLYTASNGPYYQQLNRLKIGGFSEYIKDNFISEDIGFSKPSTQFFNACIERVNRDSKQTVSPEEILIIGDSLTSDIAGGKGVGIKTCFYNRKNAQIDVTTADYIINSLKDIKDIL